MLVVVARYKARPGNGDAVAQALRSVVGASREEPGCVLYTVNRSADEPDEFLLYERYGDERDLEAHRQTPHFREVVLGQVVPLLETREVEFFQPLEP